MARPIKKNIYQRIEEQKNKIKETEELLVTLNNELQDLYAEKDMNEMKLLLAKMKESGLDIETALAKLSTDSLKDKDKKDVSSKNKEVK